MNVLIDTLCCGNQMYGVSRVLLEHLKRLSGPGYPHLSIHLIVSQENRAQFDLPGIHHIQFPFSLRRRGLSFPLQLLWERVALPRIVKKLSIDVFLRPNLAWYQSLPCPQAVIIHDLAEFHPQGGMQYSRLRRAYRRIAASRNARLASRILTVSKHAAREIEERFPGTAGRLDVVPNGAPEPAPRLPLDGGERCFLSVGKLLLHKNQLILCKAYVAADKAARLHAPLVFLGGDGNASDELKSYVREAGYADRIQFKGYVSEAEVGQYYRRALAFLFPTHYEGFGLPVLESMAQGVPVVCSNSACLPEVAGAAALLLDPHAESEWAKALGDIDAGRLDLDAMNRAGYANLKRFSWDASSAKLAGIMESLMPDKSPVGPAAVAAVVRDTFPRRSSNAND